MLTKTVLIGLIQILENGVIQIREDTVIIEDGIEISRTYHRSVLEPGPTPTDQPELVRKIAELVWTPEVIEERRIQLEKLRDTILGLQ